jgi:hypothetical protein
MPNFGECCWETELGGLIPTWQRVIVDRSGDTRLAVSVVPIAGVVELAS